MWISVLVWSAYLTADWLTTFALSRLSYTQGKGENSNALWAIWAPLLLLHLGGPDSITAYSLEDNQLWVRHLLGLVVHMSVAIYVILKSWKSSWFSFLSLPALVAGVIKYGERTRVLKLVSNDNHKHLDVSFDRDREYYSTRRVGGPEYVRVLVMAHKRLYKFRNYLVIEGESLIDLGQSPVEANISWDVLEVQMGLMYDLLYTKAAVIYTRVGFIMRCISFGCTVTVLVGYAFRIVHFKSREEDDEIDIAITGVLIVGALALEIYAAIVIFSSNWMMLWLIKRGRMDCVKWLGDRFPWLFNKKKNWSQMMGQFDLLGYYRKFSEPDVRSPGRKMLMWVSGRYEDTWDRYQHTTLYSVHLVYDTISELRDPGMDQILDPHFDPNMSDADKSARRELDETWKRVGYYPDRPGIFLWLVMCLHLATEICYREDNPSGSNSSLWKQNREVSKVLSDYMMYLLIMHPSLLPNVGSLRWLEKDLHFLRLHLGGETHNVDAVCRRLLGRNFQDWREIVLHLNGKEKPRKWKIIKQMWLRTLHAATRGEKGYGQKHSHFQHLRQGGELLTLIWFINPLTKRTLPEWSPSGGGESLTPVPPTGFCFIM
ncbi:hypothetical protein RHMOL_Rhmol01G0018400 [Rhododendron molle]|uniref:Uncharacterized protein n=1 Tax=Rhododendron molle TaxID=49168 RepID=A0ACC0PXM7_RHOML|nr:hypothetical protein RHMOL_Rhmol01G0018400 [Rhododendron molle]